MFIAVGLLFINVYAGDFKCSPGCINGCEADYTCSSGCSENYHNDTSCLYCRWANPNDAIWDAYIPRGDECYGHTNVIQKTGWLPKDESIEILEVGNTKTFKLNQDAAVDSSFFIYKQKYRIGKWFKIDMNSVTGDHIFLNVTKNNDSNAFLSVDVTNSQNGTYNGNCVAHVSLNETLFENRVLVPKYDPIYNPIVLNGENFYYVFVNIEGYAEVDVTVYLGQVTGKTGVCFFLLTQSISDDLASDLTKKLSVNFPLEQYGIISKPMCIPNVMMKLILFEFEFKGSYSILIDTRKMDRVNYIQEYTVHYDEFGKKYHKCANVWSGTRHGVLADEYSRGAVVRIKGTTNERRNFSIMTEEQGIDITAEFSAICPNDCNSESGNGNCLVKEKKCKCNDQYGGDDCHSKCFYNGKWQVEDNSDLCYFDSLYCDQWCHCEPGYEMVDHLCVSKTCASGGIAPNEECYQGSEGCLINCQCQTYLGWFKGKEGKCINTLCGNGIIDDLKLIGGAVRREECDNGTNCDMYCRCTEGYEPDENDPTSCVEKRISVLAIAGIAVGSFVVFIVLIVLFVLLLVFVLRYKKVDTSIYKQQQPTYHYYIQGSTSNIPSKASRHMIDPIELDYGNSTTATAIMDTRFERMEVSNYSRNKWMMIIFHTPNNPKYVFHFEPQVIMIRPHSTPKLLTSYMTLHCTTKIRDMKIPYTVWFSKSKSTLESIAELLKNKTFENWNQDDQRTMDKLCKNVRRHFHYHITIKTDAASSTFIDMEELNMSEKPIAEGANGRVFIGSYRSVPVAIKQFRWENLTDEEMNELKQGVINECEIMSKLRNPFIANYMGSVTYVPQVSMVIQFFVLGSLGEYLRKENEDYVKLPYKLKIRMLFDTARGMEFLHENRIMHLDLKPDNLLVNSLYTDSACCIKITDFGTSRFTKKTNKSEDKGLGTPIYTAPESYHDEYTNAGDVYSYAITTWELFYQEEPYKEFKSLFDIKNHVESGKRLGFDETMPLTLKTLIQDCWKSNPQERPTFDQICKRLVKVDEDAVNHMDLDNDVSDEKIEQIIGHRTQRMQRQLNEISHD